MYGFIEHTWKALREKSGRPRRRWESNIIVFYKELGYELYYNKSTMDFNEGFS